MAVYRTMLDKCRAVLKRGDYVTASKLSNLLGCGLEKAKNLLLRLEQKGEVVKECSGEYLVLDLAQARTEERLPGYEYVRGCKSLEEVVLRSMMSKHRRGG